MECWSNGVLEYWSSGSFKIMNISSWSSSSSTPLLHYSIIPSLHVDSKRGDPMRSPRLDQKIWFAIYAGA